MSYKPDESVLIAWMYDELETAERHLVDQYLLEHPEVRKQLEDMGGVLKTMTHVKDKEVIAPPIFMDQPVHDSFWQNRYFKTSMAIAASLLLLLVAGRVLGPEISYSQGTLRISFGKSIPLPSAPQQEASALTAEAVQQMINTSLVKTSGAIDAHLTETQQKLNNTIQQSLNNNSRKVDDMIKTSALASQEQLRSYVSGLQTENLRVMKDYFQLSSKDQKDYVENLLVGFSKYVQEQRAQDMVLVQNRFNNLEKNSDQFKQETEQLLTSIISNSPAKKISY